jgi:2,5-diketo-D-gluconate reductase B
MKTIEIDSDPVPALGYGTFELEGEACREGVSHALALGYRHIDTASFYGNEEQVGRAIAESPVARDEIFLTTKIWWEDLALANMLASARRSLRKLRTDYVDLLLIHWPSSQVPLDESLTALTTLKQEGKARHIGVSNFPPSLLRQAVEAAPVVCEQVEYHPFLGQQELLSLVHEHGLMLTAYSPLARGRVMNEAKLAEIGRRHAKNPAQVALRWLLQQPRVAAIPKASTAEHRQANLAVFDFELSAEEMAEIHALARDERLIDPSFAPDWER